MANIKNNSEKNDEQRSEFAKDQELKSKVYEAIEEQLKKSSEEAFSDEGFKSRMDTAFKKDKETNWNKGEGQQGWNRGVYGDGTTYGMGAKKGEVSVTVNRVKGPEATNGFFEKNLSFGGKKMVVEIHVDIDVDSKTMDITYQTTEQPAFRGYSDDKGAYMIEEERTFRLDDMSKFKKNFKKMVDNFAAREARYFLNTKLGIEDRVEKSINSMVEMNMKKLSLTDILKGDFDEALDKIMEAADKNHPEVVDANSPGNLLFDDLDECEAKMGKDYRDHFESMMKKYGADSPKELKPSEWETIDQSWKSKEEKGIEEVTTAGAGAGSVGDIGYDAPFGDVKRRKLSETPYASKKKKRRLNREGTPDGWTTVELDADGYAPKGMDKNHALGLHGVEVNSDEEDKLSKGSPKGRAGMKGKKSKGLSESDLSKRKFVSLNEHEEKGVNKRYIITHKRTADEEKDRWSKLTGFEKNSTIKLAESCGCTEPEYKEQIVSREEGEKMNEQEFMKRNDAAQHGDEVEGRVVVVVPKPNSLSGAEFKVFEDDYLNESKAYILDMNTGNLVNNPNYKGAINESYTRKSKEQILNESVEVKKEVVELPNKAYIYDEETKSFRRNPNFKS